MDIIFERKPRHKWSIYDRRLLCIFSKLYQNNVHDATKIINSILADCLVSEGFETGMPVSTLNSQLVHMREGSHAHDVWQAIHVDIGIAEARKAYRALRDRIEDTALELGISLRLQVEEVESLKRHGHRLLGQRGKNSRKLRGVLGDLFSSDDDTENDVQSPGKKRRMSPSADSIASTPTRTQAQLPTLNSNLSGGTNSQIRRKKSWNELTGGKPTPVWQTVERFGNKVRKDPRLLYRWYSSRSQGLNTPTELRGGRFLNKGQAIPPPEWDLASVRNHLIPEKQPSPYISFRESMRSGIFNALREDHNADACITVIDFQKLKATSLHWGEDAFQACPALVKKFKLKLGGKKRNYTATGEWLVYGKVDGAAIISTIRMCDIISHAQQNPVIGRLLQLDKFGGSSDYQNLLRQLRRSPALMDYQAGQAGRAVGLLSRFMCIPDELREQFTAKVAASWHLLGFDKAKRNKLYEAYMNGVFDERSWDGTTLSDNDIIIEDFEDNENDENSDSANDTMGAEHHEERKCMAIADEQDLLDTQLQMELSSSLRHSSTTWEANAASRIEKDGASVGPRISSRVNTLEDKIQHFSQVSRYAQPRSSSLFTFERPRIPGPPTDWEATKSRDASPASTERSALDTFTTELLAKAEECSTVGSFGRGPSTIRWTSEAQTVGPENTQNERDDDVQKMLRREYVVIDLMSDEDEDGEEEQEEEGDDDDDDGDESVEDLGLEIVGSRVIKE